MFDTQPSIFDLPTYLRKKPLVTGSPPEQSQPRQPVKVPYRPLAQAYSSRTADTTPLFFRPLPSPAQRQQAAAAARQLAAKSSAIDPQTTSQPSSAPAPSESPAQPQQTPPLALTSPQSTEEDPRMVAAPKEAGAQVEAESTLRNQPPTAFAAPAPQPPQTPPTATTAPGGTEYDSKVVEALKQAAAQSATSTQPPSAAPDQQPSTHSTSPASQSPSQPPPPQQPQTPPATTAPEATEYDPKAVEAHKKAAAQTEAQEALRKEREPRRTLLESAGQRGTATSLEALEDEIRTRHAELVKKFPQRGPEYEAGMKALLQHIQQQEAQIQAKAEQLPEIAAHIYQQWGKGVAGNWITGQALREGDKDSPGAPLSQSHLDALDQEAARYGVDPKDLRHHLEMQRLKDWSRGDTDAAVRHGPGGSIWVNPARFLDENAYRQAVEQAWGSEAEKAAAMDRFPELQERAAKAQLDVLRSMGYYNQWEAGQPKGMSEVEKLAKFSQEHSGILNSGAWAVRMRQALLGVVGAVGGIGKSVVGAYAAVTGSHGAMDVYNKLSYDTASISAYSSALPTGQWVHMGTSMVVSTLPSLGVGGLTSLTLKAGGAAFGLRTAAQVAQAAQTWGLRGAAATSGLQTFGSMYGDAVQGYMKRGDSEATALNKAFIPALAGAASTYLLTAAGGTQGIEALLRKPAFKENFRQWFKAVAAGSVKEGLREEAPDQLIQGIIERYTHNPDKPWKDIIEETLHAGIGGALLGGAVEATTTGITPAKTSQDQPQPQIPSNTTPVGRPSTPPLSVEQSQKLIHHVMNRPVEQRGHPTTQADFAQAQWVVREQVRKLESQTTPLSEAQQKALADAKAALARVEQPNTTTGLPDETTILDVGGAAAHGKTMDPWDNNPNGQERTMPEAVEIFRNNFKEFMQLYGKKLGVNISPDLIDQINFVPDSNIPAENGQRKWAAYKPNAAGTGIKGEYTWKDLLNNGKINVRLDPEVLKSDQAIAGIFAHEMLELHGIQDMMDLNANRSLPKEKLQQLINDLHEQAINLQNKFVQFMKDKARKQ